MGIGWTAYCVSCMGGLLIVGDGSPEGVSRGRTQSKRRVPARARGASLLKLSQGLKEKGFPGGRGVL